MARNRRVRRQNRRSRRNEEEEDCEEIESIGDEDMLEFLKHQDVYVVDLEDPDDANPWLWMEEYEGYGEFDNDDEDDP
jgi:hypothetical protein